MTSRQRIASIVSATLFVAGMAFAQTTVTPPKTSPPDPQSLAKVPTFSVLTLCHVTDKDEFCCDGEMAGVGAEAALVTILAAYQCQTHELKTIDVKGVSPELKPVQGVLTFENVCTKEPTAQECAAQAIFARGAHVLVEQPKGSVVLHGPGFVSP